MTSDAELEADTTENSWLKRLREVYAGLTQYPAPGGCAGDPSAWERDTNRRARERQVREAVGPVGSRRNGAREELLDPKMRHQQK